MRGIVVGNQQSEACPYSEAIEGLTLIRTCRFGKNCVQSGYLRYQECPEYKRAEAEKTKEQTT